MLENLKQIVPSSACLRCDVCCRYPERTSSLSPYFFAEEAKEIDEDSGKFIAIGKRIGFKAVLDPCEDHYACPFFGPEKNSCRIYASRPFDCRLYPFMVTYDESSKSVVLAVDKKCPYLMDKLDSKVLREYVDYLTDRLEGDDVAEEINYNKNFINVFQEDSFFLKRLEGLSRRICLSEYQMTRISLKDKELFDECFLRCGFPLSSFSFTGIYIWSSVLNILWKKIEDALCVFAGCDRDYFLILPPLGGTFNKPAAKEAMEILSSINGAGCLPAARIENIPKKFLKRAASLNLKTKISTQEYIYNQGDLAGLKGGRFKSKRSPINHFTKNYKYIYRSMETKDVGDCLDLYRDWAFMRLKNVGDDYYRMLVEDSYFAQEAALLNLDFLRLQGRVVEIGGKIKGYTLGYPLNKDTFVIIFETVDLKVKGLSQFIFREFSRELSDYRYINTLSDSDLENLRIIKDSYRPIKKIPVFAAYPKA